MFGATKVEEDFILILRTPDISFLRANPIIVSKIKNEFQSGVWFVEGEATDRRFIENLFFPAKIISINLIWLPDGNKLTKVIVEERQDPRYGADIKKIQKIAKAVRNMELIIEFEHKN